MDVSFDPIYLANGYRDVVSQWNSSVSVLSSDFERSLDKDSIVLPPRQKPLYAFELQLDIELFSSNESISSCLTQAFAEGLNSCLEYWQDLNYRATVQVMSEHCIRVSLECQIFSTMKTKNLLEQPLSIMKHMNLRLVTVAGLKVQATFIGASPPVPEAIRQCNVFLVSLFISQLEFQFPLAFSRVCRLRFIQQEASLGPVSYALTNSAIMVPRLVKIISDDRTATTCYRIIQISSDRRKLARLLKFKTGVSPTQILKHSCTYTSNHADC
ncbi:LAME_0F18184g1_1 [Lachancea meyersii CBS 8951]|uniref:LAME_0F18184g1_1 n=1 Tax=Lachancea meyersii CBS 8951 TaxID=1266667 RepID=A0A1G4K0H9_9SACH|nr:LAME_0F18184g1_1 [Lachancea meyersii CBS 8951]